VAYIAVEVEASPAPLRRLWRKIIRCVMTVIFITMTAIIPITMTAIISAIVMAIVIIIATITNLDERIWRVPCV
jgi:hypothetical protein